MPPKKHKKNKKRTKKRFNLCMMWGILLLVSATLCLLYLQFASTSVNAKITGIANSQCIISVKTTTHHKLEIFTNIAARNPNLNKYEGSHNYGKSYNVEYQINGKTYKTTTECRGEIPNYQYNTVKLYVQKMNPEFSTTGRKLQAFVIVGFIIGFICLRMAWL